MAAKSRASKVVDELTSAGKFMRSFLNPTSAMVRYFGEPITTSNTYSQRYFKKEFFNERGDSDLSISLSVGDYNPDAYVRYSLEPVHHVTAMLRFGMSREHPDGAQKTGFSAKARDELRGYGVYERVVHFVKGLRRKWPASEEEAVARVKQLLGSIDKTATWQDQ